MSEAKDKARLAKEASVVLAKSSAATRSDAIRACASALLENAELILEANARDYQRGLASALPDPLLDRLLLSEERLQSIAGAMQEVASQADPLHQVISGSTLESGIRIERVRVPLGVVAIIYEARPNVTADAIALCLRSGNACVLKGGSAAKDSCKAIVEVFRDALFKVGLPQDSCVIIESTDRSETRELMCATGLVDVLIPRGGKELIKSCVENAQLPVIETGTGNCHIYVHKAANLEYAQNILVNAKTSRPGVCNAAESLLIDSSIANEALPQLLAALSERGVELVGDEEALRIASEHELELSPATELDWGQEYLDLKMSVCCVDGIDEAIKHINHYGTGHSEAIITNDYEAAEKFLAEVDAACVYVNASTRFTDGGVFGLGGEIGISTQKLHARGPMGANELTTTKYVIRGEGQIR